MPAKSAAQVETFDLGRSYVRDGFMRAYANRFAVIALLSGIVALLSLGFAVYVRLQPPTIIRITPDGEATVISGRAWFHKNRLPLFAGTPNDPEPMEYEKEGIIRSFLNDYLNYDYRDIGDRWSDALNLTAEPLRSRAVEIIKKEHRLDQARAAQVRSTFEIREIDPSKQDPLAFTVFGVRNVYRMDGTRETAEQMVNRYEIRLALLNRSATVPRGLLIAQYKETQIDGEAVEPAFAVDNGVFDSGDSHTSSTDTQP